MSKYSKWMFVAAASLMTTTISSAVATSVQTGNHVFCARSSKPTTNDPAAQARYQASEERYRACQERARQNGQPAPKESKPCKPGEGCAAPR